jgi:plastocyanin
MIARVQSFYYTLEEEQRKALGDEIHWQIADDTSNHAAMLDDTVNIIVQARKALMSRNNEGVKITIEQGGFHDPKTRIRPKYCINIERVKV